MQTMHMSPLRSSPQDRAAPGLVEIIELKWLLRGHGIDLHVERLQNDEEYARRMLDLAATAPSSALREAAAGLRKSLTPGG